MGYRARQCKLNSEEGGSILKTLGCRQELPTAYMSGAK